MSQRVRLFVEQLERRECPGSLLNLEPPVEPDPEPAWSDPEVRYDPAEKVYEPSPGLDPGVLDPTHWKYETPDLAQLTDDEWAEVVAFVDAADAGHDFLYADDFTLAEPAEAEAIGKAPVDDQLVARAAGYYQQRNGELADLIGQSAAEQARLLAMITGGLRTADIVMQAKIVRFAAERVAWAGTDQADMAWALEGATAAESAGRIRAVSAQAHSNFRSLQEQVRLLGQQLQVMPRGTLEQLRAYDQTASAYMQLRGRALEAYNFAAGLGLAIAGTSQ